MSKVSFTATELDIFIFENRWLYGENELGLIKKQNLEDSDRETIKVLRAGTNIKSQSELLEEHENFNKLVYVHTDGTITMASDLMDEEEYFVEEDELSMKAFSIRELNNLI